MNYSETPIYNSCKALSSTKSLQSTWEWTERESWTGHQSLSTVSLSLYIWFGDLVCMSIEFLDCSLFCCPPKVEEKNRLDQGYFVNVLKYICIEYYMRSSRLPQHRSWFRVLSKGIELETQVSVKRLVENCHFTLLSMPSILQPLYHWFGIHSWPKLVSQCWSIPTRFESLYTRIPSR